MAPHITVLGVVIVYLGVCLILGLRAGRGASESALGYVAGDRTLGFVLMYFITGATIFSAFAFLGAPGRAYAQGGAAFYILGYAAVGIVPLYFLGPRAARVGRRYGFVTQGEMVAYRYRSPQLALIMAAVSVVAFVPYLALQMKGAGYVLERCSNGAVPPWLGALVVYAIVAVYVLKSGVLGVGWTNTFQGVFMMVIAWGLGLYLPYALHGGVQPMFEALARSMPEHLLPPGGDGRGEPWSWNAYSSAVIVSGVGFCLWPHIFMRAFSARDERTIRRTVLVWPLFQLFLVPLFLIGFAGVGFSPPPPEPDQILPHLLMHLSIPTPVVGLFCAGALAASMSSGDAMAHAAASIAVRDGAVTGLRLSLSPPRERTAIRGMVLVVLVAAYALALVYQGTLVYLLLTTFGAVVQFAPAVLLALYDPRSTSAEVTLGLVLGTAVTVVLIAWPALQPGHLHPGLVGLAVNVACITLIRLVRPTPASPVALAFIQVAAQRRPTRHADPDRPQRR